MIVGDFCLKETPHAEVGFLTAIVRVFICVGIMAASFYNQTNSLSRLLLFRVNEASECNVVPAARRHQAIAT